MKYTPAKKCPLAGSSVHMDRMFIGKYDLLCIVPYAMLMIHRFMPRFIDHLHYRIIDVSSIKELTRSPHANVRACSREADLTQAVAAREDGASSREEDESPVCARNCSGVTPLTQPRALDDIIESIEELRFYRAHVFVCE